MAAAWRIVKRRHADHAFDGEGARLFGGRWNSPGRRVVYTSASKSLALLELLVHLDSSQPLPSLVAFTFAIDEGRIEALQHRRLGHQWRTLAGTAGTRRVGDEWLDSCRSLALAVPSVIVPEEWNYLLNPAHPAFARLRVGKPAALRLDPRLA
jgi:RES domain-containing protein